MTPKQRRIKEMKRQQRQSDMWDLVLYVILGAGVIKIILLGLEKL